jgi:hypothetical protein
MVSNYNTVYALGLPMGLVVDLVASGEADNGTCNVSEFVQDLVEGLRLLGRVV